MSLLSQLTVLDLGRLILDVGLGFYLCGNADVLKRCPWC